MLRLSLVFLALAACTETDTPPATDPGREHLDRMLAENAIVCWQGSSPFIPDADTQRVLACMNDALASGARAQTHWQYKDAHMFTLHTYVFTIDHHVKVFETHPNGDGNGLMSYVTEKPLCTGPFRLAGSTLAWDGCP